MRRIPILLVLLLLALPVAGCGGGSSSSDKGGSSGVVGADLAPADATAFLSMKTDESSDQWTQMKKLLENPTIKKALDDALGGSVTISDIEQALGENTVVVGFGKGENPPSVMLTDSSDPEKLKSVLASIEGTKKAVTREIDGWTAVAETESVLDQFESATKSGSKLSDSAQFKTALEGTPAEAVATAYFPGAALQDVASSAAAGTAASSVVSGAAAKQPVEWLRMSLTPTDNGFSIEGTAKASKPLENGSTGLLSEVPGATSFVIDINGKALGLDAQVQKLRNNDQYGSQIAQFEALLGLKLEDLAALAGSEIAVYGSETGLGLLIKAPDPDKVLGALDKLVTMLASGKAPQATTIAGIQVKELTLGQFKLYYGAAGGNIFVATDQASLPGSKKLADDAAYSAAAEKLGLPDSAVAVFYVDFERLPQLIEGLGTTFQQFGASVSTEITGSLKGIEGFDSILGYVAAGTDNEVDFKAELALK